MIFKFKVRPSGPIHTRTHLFGKFTETASYCHLGNLCFRNDEWLEFSKLLDSSIVIEDESGSRRSDEHPREPGDEQQQGGETPA